jgi:hypothetical protein
LRCGLYTTEAVQKCPPASEDLRSASKRAPTFLDCEVSAATAVTPRGPGPSSALAREAEVSAGTRSTTAAHRGLVTRLLMRGMRFIGHHCGL